MRLQATAIGIPRSCPPFAWSTHSPGFPCPRNLWLGRSAKQYGEATGVRVRCQVRSRAVASPRPYTSGLMGHACRLIIAGMRLGSSFGKGRWRGRGKRRVHLFWVGVIESELDLGAWRWRTVVITMPPDPAAGALFPKFL